MCDRIRRSREKRRIRLLGHVGIAIDDPVERCVTMLPYLPALCSGGILFCSKPTLPGAEVFRNLTDARFDEIPIKPDRPSCRANSPKCHMDVWVLGIVVRDGDPFERGPKVLFHPGDKIASEALQVDSVAEFWRYDQLPETLVTRLLPTFEPPRDVDRLVAAIESSSFRITLAGCALAGQVSTMGSPLPRFSGAPPELPFRFPLMRA
jgi:hypothetical protein